MKYYTCANTSAGFVDFTDENIFDIDNKIRLICKNAYVKSYILGFLGGECEKIICTGSRNLTDGLIFRNKNTAVVSNCKSPLKTFNLDEYFDFESYPREFDALYERVFSCYGQAKEIHDQWESIYINNMDFQRLDDYCDSLIERFVKTRSFSGTGKNYKRFFGTSTINGSVNYINDITDNLGKRYFIKGRPGTGKSTFLKKLSAKLKENGFDVEEYYCSFDPNSLDMVVSRELSFCVFDSTPPHEKFPERENDEILDFYTESGLSGVDERFERELCLTKSTYNNKISEGMRFLKKAWQIKEECDKRGMLKIEESEMRKIAKNIGC